MTLEGFLDGHTVRKKFRFIRKAQEIAEHRGDKVDDGIVRVEYCFEQRAAEYVPAVYPYWNWTYIPPPVIINPSPVIVKPRFIYYGDDTTDGGSDWQVNNCTAGDPKKFDTIVSCNYSGGEEPTSANLSADNANLSADTQVSFTATPNADEGITVPGADTHQHFSAGYIGATDSSHVITIRLRGTKNSGAVVEKPVGTKDKIKCPHCDRKWNARQHFCGNCGANLGH
jgi:hypothetical protein